MFIFLDQSRLCAQLLYRNQSHLQLTRFRHRPTQSDIKKTQAAERGEDSPRANALKVEDSHLSPRKPPNPMSRPHIGARYPMSGAYALGTRDRRGIFFHTTDQKFAILGN